MVFPDDVGALARALDELLSDHGLADEFRHKGLERTRMFTWEKTALATLAVYQSLC